MKFEHIQKLRKVAVVGAATLLGKEVLALLEEFEVKPDTVSRLANPEDYLDQGLAEETETFPVVDSASFSDVDLVLFASPTDVTRRFLPHAQKAGCLVWDFSGAFRSLEGVPMVVPGINETELLNYQGRVASSPCASAVALAIALQPFIKNYGIKTAVVSTYQPASDLGAIGFDDLSFQSAQMLNGNESDKEGEAHPLAFNCIPWIGDANGLEDERFVDSPEEIRIRREVNRLLGVSLDLNVTAVRVPTFYGVGASVYLELDTPPPSLEPVKEMLEKCPGIKMLDRPNADIFPTNRECSGADPVFIGRLRRGAQHPEEVTFWLMADNLRRGAALNALESVEYWLRTKNPAPVIVHPGSPQTH